MMGGDWEKTPIAAHFVMHMFYPLFADHLLQQLDDPLLGAAHSLCPLVDLIDLRGEGGESLQNASLSLCKPI